MKNFDSVSFHNRGGEGCPALKTTMENTNYENWQLEKYGNVIGTIESTPDGELYESGIEDEFGGMMSCLLDMVNTYCQSHYINIVECE